MNIEFMLQEWHKHFTLIVAESDLTTWRFNNCNKNAILSNSIRNKNGEPTGNLGQKKMQILVYY